MSELSCRSCKASLDTTFVDLGSTPLANSYLGEEQLSGPEPHYPLHARVCGSCMLVQVEAVVLPEEIFSDYAYFSSVSASWVDHARQFARSAQRHLGLTDRSSVIEVASNDGYLLKHFVDAGIPVLGVEPAANVGDVARAAGVPTETAFFGTQTAVGLPVQADLLVANNVLGHVPDLNDFVEGLRIALKPHGVVSIEVPHLLRLIEGVQFDTIYHEHFSYFSVLSARRALAACGIELFDVETLATHGGSVRLWGAHVGQRQPTSRLADLLNNEVAAGLDQLDTYASFPARVDVRRAGVVDFLQSARAEGRSTIGYGAAAKGNTLLNFCHVTQDLLPFVVDLSPHKQGRFLPGTHLPIRSPEAIDKSQPDHVLLLAWNLENEITEQLHRIRTWGATFVTTMPAIRIVA